MILVHCVRPWGTVHRLSMGHTVEIEQGAQSGVLLAVVIWGQARVVVEGEPIHKAKGTRVMRGLKGVYW